MNKPLIITIAVGILLLALGSWVYLFLFGAPQSPNEIFTDLGITPPATETIPGDTTAGDGTSQVDVTNDQLQQLTLRPVAGYTVPAAASVVYIEQGTGHLYRIDLTSGEEVRLTNTTIPTVTTADLNQDASAVVLVTGLPGERAVFLGQRADDAIERVSLPPTAENFTFISTSSLLYSVPGATGARGYVYNLLDNQQREVFTSPFRDIDVHYVADDIFISNQPAVELEGGIYEITGTTVTPITNPVFGLVALFGDNWYARSYSRENQLFSELVSRDDESIVSVPSGMIPEKCVWDTDILVCANPFEIEQHTYISDWYQGTLRANDALWRIDPVSGGAQLVINPERAVGRPLDMTEVSVSNSGDIFFINRLDNSLWRYVETAR